MFYSSVPQVHSFVDDMGLFATSLHQIDDVTHQTACCRILDLDRVAILMVYQNAGCNRYTNDEQQLMNFCYGLRRLEHIL